MANYPRNYEWILSRFGTAMKAHRRLGEALLAAGPLEKS